MSLIQVCSDLHLEKHDISISDFELIIKPVAKILILAGDIGNPFETIFKHFITYCSTNFKYVLFISGNHEYYYSDMDTVDNHLNSLFNQFVNVIYLNNETFQFEDILFVGTTLWTKLDDTLQSHDLNCMMDYKYIKDFTPSIQKSLFNKNLTFIESKLKHNSCIIISHHAPSFKCIEDKYINDKFISCFSSNLDYLFENPNLIGWVYGHLHNNYINYTKSNFLYANCYRTIDYKNSTSVIF
jgi:predicted phosphohydrolase